MCCLLIIALEDLGSTYFWVSGGLVGVGVPGCCLLQFWVCVGLWFWLRMWYCCFVLVWLIGLVRLRFVCCGLVFSGFCGLVLRLVCLW